MTNLCSTWARQRCLITVFTLSVFVASFASIICRPGTCLPNRNDVYWVGQRADQRANAYLGEQVKFQNKSAAAAASARMGVMGILIFVTMQCPKCRWYVSSNIKSNLFTIYLGHFLGNFKVFILQKFQRVNWFDLRTHASQTSTLSGVYKYPSHSSILKTVFRFSRHVLVQRMG